MSADTKEILRGISEKAVERWNERVMVGDRVLEVRWPEGDGRWDPTCLNASETKTVGMARVNGEGFAVVPINSGGAVILCLMGSLLPVADLNRGRHRYEVFCDGEELEDVDAVRGELGIVDGETRGIMFYSNRASETVEIRAEGGGAEVRMTFDSWKAKDLGLGLIDAAVRAEEGER